MNSAVRKMSDDSETARALRRKDSEKAERSAAASKLARGRHARTAPRTRRRQCARAARALWDSMTAAERSVEMRRRRRLGLLRKKKAALGVSDTE